MVRSTGSTSDGRLLFARVGVKFEYWRNDMPLGEGALVCLLVVEQ